MPLPELEEICKSRPRSASREAADQHSSRRRSTHGRGRPRNSDGGSQGRRWSRPGFGPTKLQLRRSRHPRRKSKFAGAHQTSHGSTDRAILCSGRSRRPLARACWALWRLDRYGRDPGRHPSDGLADRDPGQQVGKGVADLGGDRASRSPRITLIVHTAMIKHQPRQQIMRLRPNRSGATT